MRKLKRGVALYATETPDQYLIGTPKRVLRIYTPEAKNLINLLVVGASDAALAEYISQFSDTQRAALYELVAELDAHRLCERRVGALALSKRFISSSEGRATRNSRPERDAAFVQLQNRVAAELSQTTWAEDNDDGGIESLSSRQDLLIEISGTNRVATIMYSLLLASGATQTRFTQSARANAPLIGDLDIAVGSFTTSHIGFSFDKQCQSLRREVSLFPLDKESNSLDEFSTPDLHVHCGDIDPEKISLWMSSGQPFFHIPVPQADTAKIGPLVIPGKSPCLRCVDLISKEQCGVTDQISIHGDSTNDYPIVVAYSVAAIAVSLILKFSPKKSSETTGRVISLDYQSLANPQTHFFDRHPLCGCAF